MFAVDIDLGGMFPESPKAESARAHHFRKAGTTQVVRERMAISGRIKRI